MSNKAVTTTNKDQSNSVMTPLLSREDMADIKTFADAHAAIAAIGGTVRDSAEFGDGFTLVGTEQLQGKTFMILSYQFSEGDFGPFVVIRGITEDDQKVVLTDGSTGIYRQMVKYATAGVEHLIVKGGVRRSDYTAEATGAPATTFYLSE